MEHRRTWLVSGALFVITMALYWPVTDFPFVSFDDQAYVYQNSEVLKGLSWAGIKWAVTAVVDSNWHPLTILSHMADCTLYRQSAGGHHLTSILLHSASAVLLWLLLKRITGRFWPSAFVAALFAWHPLNVESAAWVAERKNVLSTFFFMLTLWGYVRYVEKPRAGRYLLALAAFALGLAAKPMLVTLPFLLLLLDYWPLRRISFAKNLGEQTQEKPFPAPILEKLPFLILSIADCVITFLVQNQTGAVRSLTDVPLESRLLNVPVAYATYVAKLFWPAKLCAFYDFPDSSPMAAAISLILLAMVTWAAWHLKARFRWLLVGWLWFLGALVPVIGLVQSGYHSMADRNTYLPMIGLFLIMAFTLNECWVARPRLRAFMVILPIVFLCVCLGLTGRQITFWRDSVALFTQVVAVNPASAHAHDLLGRALAGSGRQADAIAEFDAAARLNPGDGESQYDLGLSLIDAGKGADAESHLAAAVAQTPDSALLRNTHGVTLLMSGRTNEAGMEFARAAELLPAYPKPYFNLGKVLLAEGQLEPAITNFSMALQLQPDWPEALENLAAAYADGGNYSNAMALSNLALSRAQAHNQLAQAAQIAVELTTYSNALAKPVVLPNHK